jgi:hypothetical protein
MVQIEGSLASAIDDEDDLDGGSLKQVSAYGVETLGLVRRDALLTVGKPSRLASPRRFSAGG